MDLHLACKAGNLERVKQCVEVVGLDLNERDAFDSTPLFYACLCGHAEVVKYLLDKGAQLVRGSFDTERAFYGALTFAIRKILLEYKAAPNRSHPVANLFEGLLASKKYADMTFVIDGVEFNVHKFVLSARSANLSKCLQTRWSGRSNVKFTSSKLTSTAFQYLMTYLYTGVIDVSVDETSDLITLLEFVQMSDEANRVRFEKSNASFAGRERVLINYNNEVPSKLPGDIHESLSYEHYPSQDEIEVATFHLLAEEDAPQKKAEIAALYHYSDMCFEFKDSECQFHRFFAHRAVVCAQSEYIQTLLVANFKEKYEIEKAATVIPIVPINVLQPDEISPQAIQIAFNHMYTLSLAENLSEDVLLEVLVVSASLLMTSLKRDVITRLAKVMTRANVFTLLELAVIYGADKLADVAIALIEIELLHIYASEAFERASISATGKLKDDFVRMTKEFEEKHRLSVHEAWEHRPKAQQAQ